jgi:beta-N-acetylhexosaminidase
MCFLLMKKNNIFFILLFLPAFIFAQNAKNRWVDSIFNSLTFDEKIGQLYMIRAHSNKDAAYEEMVAQQIRDYKVGGICFFQGTPEKQATLNNYYQSLAKIPLFVSMDAEWGLGMRLKESAISFPKQLMLGAVQDNSLLYEMGVEIARQCLRLGVNVNFAPDTDINNNAANPVIGMRSFGEDKKNVIAKSYQYMLGMQDRGVMACMKHFPGHGDTDTDSHLDLPLIPHDRSRIDSVELMPFRALGQRGVQSVMVAHLNVPALDATNNLPTSLSRKVVTDLLRKKLGYEGLIFTDGMGMKGVVKYFKQGHAEAMALAAGNDIILLPENIAETHARIKEYLATGKLDTIQFFESVKRLLSAKYDFKLYQKYQPVVLDSLSAQLNSQDALSLKRRLIANALTTVRDENGLLPLVATEKIGSLSIGATALTPFQTTLDKYAKIEHYQIGKNLSAVDKEVLLNNLGQKEIVIVGLHDLNTKPKEDYGITTSTVDLVYNLAARTKVILTVFGIPYTLRHFDNIGTVLEGYDEDPMTQDLAAQAIFGASGTNGRLPVRVSDKSFLGAGVTTKNINRLGYDLPERVGLSSEKLKKIDQIADEIVRTAAAPGCVVLVAKDGKVVYNKAFGYHTYDKIRAMRTDDLFDLASMTKICATTFSLMKLHSEGKIDMKQPMSNYLSILKGSNKATLTMEEIMTHHAGLQAWLKFYEATLDNSGGTPRPSQNFYRSSFMADYNIPVSPNLYLQKGYDEKIFDDIVKSDLRSNKEYKYSDLGLILMTKLIKEQTGMTLDDYVQKNLYQPMNLRNLTYNPWIKYPMERIPPTEEDGYFRQGRVQGYVHDMAAAMLGGVSGHAGLFGTANDVASIFEMLLNGGKMGNQQILNKSTIDLFTTRYEKSTRRGIGFDMKELDKNKTQTVAASASARTFGHTGFTGTCVWADPETHLVYVFLSNRTYPSMENNKLISNDYRIKIHQAIYDAMMK